MAPGLRGRGAPGGRRKCFARNFVTLRKRIAGRVSAAGASLPRRSRQGANCTAVYTCPWPCR